MAETSEFDEFNRAVGSTAVCHLLKWTRQRVDQLVAEGWIKKIDKGRYRIIDVIHGYVDWSRDDRRRSRQGGAAAEVAMARARDYEIRTAQRAGRLVDVDDLLWITSTIVGLVRSSHIGAPARITRDLALRTVIERELNAIDTSLANELAALAERLEAGRAYPSPTGIPDAGSVGGKVSKPSNRDGDSRPA